MITISLLTLQASFFLLVRSLAQLASIYTAVVELATGEQVKC